MDVCGKQEGRQIDLDLAALYPYTGNAIGRRVADERRQRADESAPCDVKVKAEPGRKTSLDADWYSLDYWLRRRAAP